MSQKGCKFGVYALELMKLEEFFTKNTETYKDSFETHFAHLNRKSIDKLTLEIWQSADGICKWK